MRHVDRPAFYLIPSDAYMKHFVRMLMFSVFSLWITSELLPTLTISGGIQNILSTGIALSFLMLFVRPLLKILFIPINVLTLGFFSWSINVIVVYILTLLVPAIQVHAWMFPGISWGGFVIPPIHLSYFASLIFTSLVLSSVLNVLYSISED